VQVAREHKALLIEVLALRAEAETLTMIKLGADGRASISTRD
jgi:hypothetical protein